MSTILLDQPLSVRHKSSIWQVLPKVSKLAPPSSSETSAKRSMPSSAYRKMIKPSRHARFIKAGIESIAVVSKLRREEKFLRSLSPRRIRRMRSRRSSDGGIGK